MTAPAKARALGLRPEFKSIGDTAIETGLSASAIRYYEKRGLVRPARASGQRWFGPAERGRLAMIARLRQAGFGLEEAAALSAPGWRTAGVGAAARLRQEIAQRQTALRHLDAFAGCGCEEPLTCPAVADLAR